MTANINITNMHHLYNNTHNTHNTHHVHFSTEIRIVTVPHRSELPCTQQYYADYIVCQRHHIEHIYIQQHGTLTGFNYTASLESHKATESVLEKQWFPPDENDENDKNDKNIKIDK